MTGLVYILTNPDMPGLVKVGMTTRTVADRIRELDSTGVPSSFIHQYSARFQNPDVAEKAAHAALKQFRHRKEYFRIDVPKAIFTIENLGIPYTKEYSKLEHDAHLTELRRIAEEKKQKEEALRRQEAERQEKDRQARKLQQEQQEREQRIAEEKTRKEREKLLQNPTYKSNHAENSFAIWIGGAASIVIFFYPDDNEGFFARLFVSLLIGLFVGGAAEIGRLAIVNCYLYLDGRYDHQHSETWHPKYILTLLAAIAFLVSVIFFTLQPEPSRVRHEQEPTVFHERTPEFLSRPKPELQTNFPYSSQPVTRSQVARNPDQISTVSSGEDLQVCEYIDANGRVQSTYTSSDWTCEEMRAAIKSNPRRR